jgi:hypothetical protein
MKLASGLQSEKKLVDVAGIEPATPCLQSQALGTILLAGLALFSTVMNGFRPYLCLNGLESDSSSAAEKVRSFGFSVGSTGLQKSEFSASYIYWIVWFLRCVLLVRLLAASLRLLSGLTPA